jgi:hypothetical protein
MQCSGPNQHAPQLFTQLCTIACSGRVLRRRMSLCASILLFATPVVLATRILLVSVWAAAIRTCVCSIIHDIHVEMAGTVIQLQHHAVCMAVDRPPGEGGIEEAREGGRLGRG